MAKRFKEDGAFAGTPSKRLRLDDGVSRDNYAQSGHEPSKSASKDQEGYSKEEIKDSQQLRKLLAFDQNLPKMRHGLRSLQAFLDGIQADPDGHATDRQILKDYLESTKPADAAEDEEVVWLPDLISLWDYSMKMNDGGVAPMLPLVLAQLLSVTSQILDLVPYGTGIGRTILQKRQEELLAEMLAPPKGKEYMISPALRLVRELVCFDGGILAISVYRARNFTLKSWARNVNMKLQKDKREDAMKSSARTDAILLFLSLLRYLPTEAKKELLGQKDVAAALTRHIISDPPYLIVEMLDVLKAHVVLDRKLPWDVKNRFFNVHMVKAFASLYAYVYATKAESEERSIDDVAHDFLLLACTSPHSGVLWTQSGFYPRGLDQGMDSSATSDTMHELDLDDIAWMNKYKDQVPVRNMVLSEVIQGLRPWLDTRQSELLVAIFRAAPELVANYYLQKRSFTFEPKLSATWIGYAALIFNTIQLPIPPRFGHKSESYPLPPPTSIVLDNIIPQPLTQRILVRCLSQRTKLVSFFATRLLVVAMQKLDEALRLHGEAWTSNKPLWAAASRKLVDEFCQRIPEMKEAIQAYRNIPEGDLLYQEAGSRLLRLYYELTPQVALMAKFDVAPFLIKAIQRLNVEAERPEDHTLRLMELENLFAIAGYSPGMRWFSKAEGLALSPFTALIRVYIESPEAMSLGRPREVLDSVANEHQIVSTQGQTPGLSPLLESLLHLKKTCSSGVPESIWAFVDNCATRCAAAPIKYLDLMQGTSGDNSESFTRTISPITVTMAEQLPFAVGGDGDKSDQPVLARFLSVYLGFCGLAKEEDLSGLAKVQDDMNTIFSNAGTQLVLKVPHGLAFILPAPRTGLKTRETAGQVPEGVPSQKPADLDESALEELLSIAPITDPDNSALLKWVTKAADDLVEDGYAASLARLLSSEHRSIRKEALVNILKMAAKLQASAHEDKEQVSLLLSELAESARGKIEDQALPSPVTAFACHALDVLRHPLHCLYGKVNMFLTRGPVWRLDKLPLVHEILDEEPADDKTYYQELIWLMGYLLDSLRTPADLGLFHSKRLFERILALASHPYMRWSMKINILRIVYRTTCIEGGSNTLVTRFGIISWLEAQRAGCGSEFEAGVYTALLKRVWDTCDQERVTKWSKNGILHAVEAI